MATESEGTGESLQGLNLAESIRKIAATNARADLSDEDQLLLFLQSWWSRTYNRPLKDPLLLSYTLEELLYEFYDKVERNLADQERAESAETQAEDAREAEVLDWIEEEERKEAAALSGQNAQSAEKEKKVLLQHKAGPADPTKDPDNIRWMEEQIRRAKAHLGDDFGDDLELNLDEK